MTNAYVYIDDTRQPLIEGAVWAKTYAEAIAAIAEVPVGTPVVVDFDHDLGEKKTGYDVALWLVGHGYTGEFRVHSMNPVGRNNIRSLLLRYGWKEIF